MRRKPPADNGQYSDEHEIIYDTQGEKDVGVVYMQCYGKALKIKACTNCDKKGACYSEG